jgi:hypothetical protein
MHCVRAGGPAGNTLFRSLRFTDVGSRELVRGLVGA